MTWCSKAQGNYTSDVKGTHIAHNCNGSLVFGIFGYRLTTKTHAPTWQLLLCHGARLDHRNTWHRRTGRWEIGTPNCSQHCSHTLDLHSLHMDTSTERCSFVLMRKLLSLGRKTKSLNKAPHVHYIYIDCTNAHTHIYNII